MNISGINSGLVGTGSTVLNEQARTVTGVSAEEKALNQQEEANGGVSKDGDTVTISSAGTILQKTYQASSQSTIDYLSEDTTAGLDSAAKAVASAASSIGVSTEATAQSQASAAASTVSTSSSDSTSDLSQYTTTELREMLQNGEITQQEYNEEIESRRNTQTESDEEAASEAAAGAVDNINLNEEA